MLISAVAYQSIDTFYNLKVVFRHLIRRPRAPLRPVEDVESLISCGLTQFFYPMITKEKKIQLIEQGKGELDNATVLLFADFEGSNVEELRELRKILKATGAKFRVLKKRLLKIVFQQKGIDFDPLKFEGQVGTIFSSGEMTEVVQPVYQFSKEHPSFKLVGGLNVETKEEVPFETIRMIGSLPSKEVLLAEFLGALTAPLRGLMYILQEKSKRS